MSQDKPIPDAVDGAELHLAIVAAGYNGELVEALLTKVLKTLHGAGVTAANIKIIRVPGSGEIPYCAYMTVMSGDHDCVIALGVVVAGDTPHHEIIAHATAKAHRRIATLRGSRHQRHRGDQHARPGRSPL